MMGENQFHYTLITTYSSGRHLCTDPVAANSPRVRVHAVVLCIFLLVLNEINDSIIHIKSYTTYFPALFKPLLFLVHDFLSAAPLSL